MDLKCDGAARPANKHSHRRAELQASLMCKLAEGLVGGVGTVTRTCAIIARVNGLLIPPGLSLTEEVGYPESD